jgi:photosystem II stability/assembly factor-like uncharacterized protein
VPGSSGTAGTRVRARRATRLAAIGATTTFLALLLASPAFGWSLTQLSFVDQSYGWAMGIDDDPAKYGLLRTTNGGAAWTVQKSTLAFNGTGFDVQFVNRSRGIWVNSYVYSTFDGGKHWQLRNIPGAWGGGSFVDFAGPSVVWIAGTFGSDGGGRCVARSTDGGRTWRTCLSQSTRPGRMPSGLSAPTATTAYIWSDGLRVTRNAGRTWRKVPTSYGFKLDAWWSIDFPTAKTGWVLRHDTTSLLRTRDGGRHWVKQMPGLQQRLKAMDFVSAKVGWVVGAAGAVYLTVDGGANWSYQRVPTDGALAAVDFVDTRHGWVSTAADWGQRNSLFRTTDGGATWKLVW